MEKLLEEYLKSYHNYYSEVKVTSYEIYGTECKVIFRTDDYSIKSDIVVNIWEVLVFLNNK